MFNLLLKFKNQPQLTRISSSTFLLIYSHLFVVFIVLLHIVILIILLLFVCQLSEKLLSRRLSILRICINLIALNSVNQLGISAVPWSFVRNLRYLNWIGSCLLFDNKAKLFLLQENKKTAIVKWIFWRRFHRFHFPTISE